MKNCLGIEIGHYRIKIAYAEKGELREFISERVEGIDRNDMRQYADLIKDLLKEYAIRCRNVVFVIRQEDAYVRRFELPLMTEEQIRLNLPYEFHDYIGNEMDKYVFDYAMIYADQEKMDLIGAACTKELSQQFEKLAKMAHLKLVGLVPAVLGLEWILEYAEERMADEKKALETKSDLFFRYVFLRKLQSDRTIITSLNISQLFTDCTAPFLTEGNTIQPDVLPIIIQKIFLITAIPDLINSLLTSHLHIVKVFCIF